MDLSAVRFRDSSGWIFHGAAVGYAVVGFVLGLLGILNEAVVLNILGTLLLAHAMTIAAYMIHECGHNVVFHRARDNAKLGGFLSWICGAAYGTYEDIRYKHFRHHVDNDDVVWFDYDQFFEQHPVTTKVIRVLEWFYIPAHDLLMHAVMVFTSFVIPQRRNQRLRNIGVIVVRGTLFTLLAVYSFRAAALYVVAYIVMMHILRFMDSVQHDYPYNTTLFESANSPRKGDKQWEQEHTFSNTLSLRFPMLNYLVLNFGYHNAHHANMNAPFYELPQLHAKLSGDGPSRVIPFVAQLRLYHRNRVARVYNPQPVDYPQGDDYLATAQSGRGPIGGNAASFLTSF